MPSPDDRELRVPHPEIPKNAWSRLRHDLREGIRALECLALLVKDDLAEKSMLHDELSRLEGSLKGIYQEIFEVDAARKHGENS